jgi:photosystem II stability/assembly factor-like uncharacterized protein
MRLYYLSLLLLLLTSCSAIPHAWEWERAEDGLARRMLVPVFVGHPEETDKLWAGFYGNGGLIYSADSGATWQPRPVGSADNPVFDLHYQGDTLWAASRDGLFETNDEGQTWRLTTGVDHGPVYTLTADGGGRLYAGLDSGGVWQKTNAGWRSLSLKTPVLASAGVLSIAVSPDGRQIVAGTAARGIFASQDGGSRWTQTYPGQYAPNVALNPENPAVGVASLRNRLVRTVDGGSSWHTLSLAWAAEEVVALLWLPNGVLGAGTSQGRLFQSLDSGETWTTGGEGLPATGVLSLFFQKPARLLAGTWTGLYISEDNGVSWTALETEFGMTDAQTLLNTGSSLLLGTRSALYAWQPETLRWLLLPGQTPSGAQVLIQDAGNAATIYAGTASHGVYVSRDGGSQWHALPTLQKGVPAIAVNPIQLGQIYYLAAWERVYQSTDGGLSWQARWDGLGDVIEAVSLAVDPVEPVAYVGTENGLFRTVEGQPWELAVPVLADQSVLTLLARRTTRLGMSDTELLIGATRGLYLSLDNGQTVASLNWGRGLQNVSVTALLTKPGAQPHLIAGTAYGGVYESYNGGRTWYPIGPPELSGGVVESLAWSDDGYLFVVATNGVWRGAPK